MSNISDLKFDDKNFNKHTQKGMGLLEKSLQQFGAGRSILIDKDNNIIAGNGIIEAAGQVGLDKVKVVETTGDEIVAVKRTDISLNSKEGREMALADNATAAADLEWDEEALKDCFELEELGEWGVDFKPYKEILEDEPAPVDEKNTYSVVGEIYQLGEHRIFCGSFDDDEKVQKLFGGKKATCTFTDPPYNISFGHHKKYNRCPIQNDSMKDYEFASFLDRVCATIKKYTSGGVICFMSDNELLTLREALESNGFKFSTIICWVKDHFAPGRNDFQNPKESAIYGLDEGKFDKEAEGESTDGEMAVYGKQPKSFFTSSRKLSNVWFFGKPKASKDHPTMKPVGLCAKGVLALSNVDDIVFDPFSGSGSTLIACEQTGRKCYGCEIDPKYCDVIRKRWWKLTTGSEEGWEKGTPAI